MRKEIGPEFNSRLLHLTVRITMGVDYSTTVGYGFAFPEDELPKVIKDLADGDYLGEEHLAPWLASHGFDLLDAVEVGDHMNGDTSILLYLDKTYLHFGVYDAEGVHKMGKPDLTAEERSQLYRLRKLLGTTDHPQWIVSFNVS